MNATFCRLPDGSWGIWVDGPVKVGDRVSVTRKDGKTTLQTVRRLVQACGTAWKCEIAQPAKAPRDDADEADWDAEYDTSHPGHPSNYGDS